LIRAMASTIELDPVVSQQIKIVFLAVDKKSVPELLIPASDLCEQISAPGHQPPGAGCLKFLINGALAAGTPDGAIVEIEAQVGPDNIYVFGMTAAEIRHSRYYDNHAASEFYQNDDDLARAIDALSSGIFHPNEPDLFEPIANSLMVEGDHYRVMSDFRSYLDIQNTIGVDFADKTVWTTKVLNNLAHMGRFSSDRSVVEYARDVWPLGHRNRFHPTVSEQTA